MEKRNFHVMEKVAYWGKSSMLWKKFHIHVSKIILSKFKLIRMNSTN